MAHQGQRPVMLEGRLLQKNNILRERFERLAAAESAAKLEAAELEELQRILDEARSILDQDKEQNYEDPNHEAKITNFLNRFVQNDEINDSTQQGRGEDTDNGDYFVFDDAMIARYQKPLTKATTGKIEKLERKNKGMDIDKLQQDIESEVSNNSEVESLRQQMEQARAELADFDNENTHGEQQNPQDQQDPQRQLKELKYLEAQDRYRQKVLQLSNKHILEYLDTVINEIEGGPIADFASSELRVIREARDKLRNEMQDGNMSPKLRERINSARELAGKLQKTSRDFDSAINKAAGSINFGHYAFSDTTKMDLLMTEAQAKGDPSQRMCVVSLISPFRNVSQKRYSRFSNSNLQGGFLGAFRSFVADLSYAFGLDRGVQDDFTGYIKQAMAEIEASQGSNIRMEQVGKKHGRAFYRVDDSNPNKKVWLTTEQTRDIIRRAEQLASENPASKVTISEGKKFTIASEKQGGIAPVGSVKPPRASAPDNGGTLPLDRETLRNISEAKKDFYNTELAANQGFEPLANNPVKINKINQDLVVFEGGRNTKFIVKAQNNQDGDPIFRFGQDTFIIKRNTAEDEYYILKNQNNNKVNITDFFFNNIIPAAQEDKLHIYSTDGDESILISALGGRSDDTDHPLVPGSSP